jgi:hypothetical protein
MFSESDKRNIEMTSQAANLLVQDLQGLVKSANPLLADVALEILQQAVQIEQRLKRIEAIAHTGEDSA